MTKRWSIEPENPFITSEVTSAAPGLAVAANLYGRVESGKNGSRPSLGFVGRMKMERFALVTLDCGAGAAAVARTIAQPITGKTTIIFFLKFFMAASQDFGR